MTPIASACASSPATSSPRVTRAPGAPFSDPQPDSARAHLQPEDIDMRLGRLGVWYSTDKLDGAQLRDFVRTVENNGYSNLWYPESRGYESMSLAAFLLSNSEKLVIGSSIANIYARPYYKALRGMFSL